MSRSRSGFISGVLALIITTVFLLPLREVVAERVVDPSLHNIKGGHLIVVGGDRNAPLSFFDEQMNPVGHDVDVLRAVADHLSMTTEFRLGSWFRSQNDLRDGKADILVGTAFVPERKKEFELTIPIFAESHALFVRKGNPYAGFDSLKDMKIAIEASDIISFQTARSLDLVRNVVFVENLKNGFEELSKGGVDVVITRYSSGMHLKEDRDDITVTGPPLTPGFYSLAVQKGNRELLDDLNHTIDFLKNDGTIEEINQKWLKIRTDEADSLIASPIFHYIMVALASSCVLVIWLLVWGYVLARQVRQRTRELHQMVVERTQELERQAQFRRVLRESNLTIFDIDLTKNIISEEYRSLMGQSGAPTSNYDRAIEGFLSMVHPDDRESFQEFFSRNNLLLSSEHGTLETFLEYRKQERGDDWMWVRATVSPWVDTTSHSVRALVQVKDIDQEKRNLLRMKWQAERDALTALYNRTSAESLINRALQDSSEDMVHGLYIMDLDNFKAVNDTLGHGEGDLLLIETGHMPTSLFRGTDVVARLGGDEYIIFCRDCSCDLVIKRAQSILSAMNALVVKWSETPVSLSIGIALFPTSGVTFAGLYKARRMTPSIVLNAMVKTATVLMAAIPDPGNLLPRPTHRHPAPLDSIPCARRSV